MLLKKLFRTIKLYKAQFISMIIMVALGIGIFVGFNMEWYSIEQDTGDFFSATGYADYRIVSADGFTREDALSVAGINGVDRAARFVSLVMDPGKHTAPTIRTVSGFPTALRRCTISKRATTSPSHTARQR